MIRVAEIQEKLLHLIGWKQNYDTSTIKLSDSLIESESGLYFQQAHPLITFENLSSLAPDFKNMEYPEYTQNEMYFKGAIVKKGEHLYRAKVDNSGQLPDEAPEVWSKTNLFSEWLEEKTRASVQKMVSRFVNENLAKGSNRSILENKTLFDGTGRIVDTIRNKNNVVGFEIVPLRSKGVTVKINKIGLQFTLPGVYTIYLMHSSQSAPVRTITLTKAKANSLEWFTIDNLFLPYESSYNDAGGSWYLCYSQADLPKGSEAIRKNFDWSKGPCNACSRQEYALWSAWSKYIEVHPFFVNREFVEASYFNEDFNSDYAKSKIYMWDIEKNQYTYTTNYGINLDITVSCDITDFILTQRDLFVDILMKQVAVDMLREFAYNANIRTNRHIINASRTDILYELDGDVSSIKKSGLSYQLDEAYKALSINLQGLDRICMPCVNNGIKYKAI